MILSNNSLTLDDAGLIPTHVLHAIELGQLDIYRFTEKELACRGFDAAGNEIAPVEHDLYADLNRHLLPGDLDFIKHADFDLLVRSITCEIDWKDIAQKELARRREMERNAHKTTDAPPRIGRPFRNVST